MSHSPSILLQVSICALLLLHPLTVIALIYMHSYHPRGEVTINLCYRLC